MDIVLLAAVAENGVIGRDNALPWRLKSDMQYFRKVSMAKPVLMGRKTYVSIGKPLKGRTNIVVSRDRNFVAPGVLAAPSLDNGLTAARGDALRRNAGAIIIIGGGDIYAQVMTVATHLAITEVHKSVEGNARFPAIDPTIWRETAREERSPAADDEVAFAYVMYERDKDAALRRPGAA
jgi:dihydrofolate reductase